MNIDFERRCWAEIDLDQLEENFKAVQNMAKDSIVMAVVKANGYGHGDTVVARALASVGAQCFAVSCLTEAVNLRRAGIQQPILIFGYTSPENVSVLAEQNIRQCIFSKEYAYELSAAAVKSQCIITTHLKVDTGMGRLGFNAKDDLNTALLELKEAYSLPGFSPEGIFTHFAVADSKTPEHIAYTKQQFSLFETVYLQLQKDGFSFAYKHSCNSAGLVSYPEMHLDLVRPGVILYGCNPSSDVQVESIRPAFKLKTVVSMVKEINKGDFISYGCTFCAPKDMKVATLAVGYADGYPRSLSNQGVTSIRGKAAKVLGRVCMDQIVVDVSDIPDVQLGDIATIFGEKSSDSIDDIAQKSHTINYEVICAINYRVQRVYLKNKEEVLFTEFTGGLL